MNTENGNRNISSSDFTHEPGAATYVVIWIILLLFTALTVWSAYLDLGKITIMTVLAIATVKSTIVLMYFMHVRYEKRLLIRLIIPGALVLLAIFIGLTYSDVFTR
jgi:cytochrome c oxidase subunit IV